MKTSIRLFNRGLVAAMALYGTSTAFAADTSTQLDRKDAEFIKEAAQGGQSEVELGKLALEKSQNQQVKMLGEHLQQDHSKANQELMQIAQQEGANLPSQPTRKENREVDRFQNMSGAAFDKAFAEHAIKDHEKDIDKYEKALQSCKDPSLKAWIEKNLPVLRQHLQMAVTAGSAVGVDQRTLSSADRFLSNQTGQGTAVGTAPGSEAGSSVNTPPSTTPTQPK
jgi:putative membrane protein